MAVDGPSGRTESWPIVALTLENRTDEVRPLCMTVTGKLIDPATKDLFLGVEIEGDPTMDWKELASKKLPPLPISLPPKPGKKIAPPPKKSKK